MRLSTIAILLVLGVSVAFAAPTEWNKFKTKHGKRYNATEDPVRQKIWQKNIELITKHNSEADKGHHSYRLGVNKYSDMRPDEFQKFMNGYRPSRNPQAQSGGIVNAGRPTRPTTTRKTTIKTTTKPPTTTKASTTPSTPTVTSKAPVATLNVTALPSAVDWRDQGYVTPIKDQGQCGSCWAFSATGALEGQYFKKSGTLVSLSEQNLLDCAGYAYGNYGCSGGWMNSAFTYIINNKGIDTEASYPYWARKGTSCKFNVANVGATATGYVNIQAYNETALQVAVATIGPVSVAIDASSFQFYASGIYNQPVCSTSKLNHGVLVVGYGTLNSTDYWLVKNSWGTSWGMQGYIMMSRNTKNQCDIVSAASYPTV